jgi:SAM-dependent methyltransferase
VKDGLLKRATKEIRYWTQSNWSFADIEKHYDAISEDYDEINQGTYSYFRRFTDALRLAQLANSNRFLDLCARTGKGTAHFYEKGKVKSAVCMEVSRKMGKICKQRLKAIGLKDFEWIQLTEYSLPFPDGEFDVALSLETVEHFPHPQKLVNELGRVIHPGGILILSTPNVLWEPIHFIAAILGIHHSKGPHRFVRLKRLVKMAENAGFQVKRVETNVLIPGGPHWLVEAGEWLEARLKHSVMHYIGLRRMLICRKL